MKRIQISHLAILGLTVVLGLTAAIASGLFASPMVLLALAPMALAIASIILLVFDLKRGSGPEGLAYSIRAFLIGTLICVALAFGAYFGFGELAKKGSDGGKVSFMVSFIFGSYSAAAVFGLASFFVVRFLPALDGKRPIRKWIEVFFSVAALSILLPYTIDAFLSLAYVETGMIYYPIAWSVSFVISCGLFVPYLAFEPSER